MTQLLVDLVSDTATRPTDAMKRAMDETGEAKIFSANITADYHDEMIARGEYILETFGPDADKVAFLVDGYVGGPGMVTTARRYFPNQYLHYHRAGHGLHEHCDTLRRRDLDRERQRLRAYRLLLQVVPWHWHDRSGDRQHVYQEILQYHDGSDGEARRHRVRHRQGR